MNTVAIGIGSNIEPVKNIQRAKEILAHEHLVESESTFVTTKPLGDPNQPDFINGAILVKTDNTLEAFTSFIKKTELSLGRLPQDDQWGPRPIDLDIIVWNGKVIHHDFYSREFVRKAVIELLPDLISQQTLQK